MSKTDREVKYEIWSDKLQKIYGKGDKAFEAVKKIDLRVKTGIHGFLGPNGAGKTTTMNMLVGALSITSGKAKIRDEDKVIYLKPFLRKALDDVVKNNRIEFNVLIDVYEDGELSGSNEASSKGSRI